MNAGSSGTSRSAPHSLIASHQDPCAVTAGTLRAEGWAWAVAGIAHAGLSVDGGATWQMAQLARRVDFSRRGFTLDLTLAGGTHRRLCRAVANDGATQPPGGARNEWFSIDVDGVAQPEPRRDS